MESSPTTTTTIAPPDTIALRLSVSRSLDLNPSPPAAAALAPAPAPTPAPAPHHCPPATPPSGKSAGLACPCAPKKPWPCGEREMRPVRKRGRPRKQNTIADAIADEDPITDDDDESPPMTRMRKTPPLPQQKNLPARADYPVVAIPGEAIILRCKQCNKSAGILWCEEPCYYCFDCGIAHIVASNTIRVVRMPVASK